MVLPERANSSSSFSQFAHAAAGGGGGGARGPGDGGGAADPADHHSFQGSFSAGSTLIFASKYAFFSIKSFQDLQENHVLASKFANFCKISRNSVKFVRNFWKFSEKMQNFVQK